MRTLQAALVLAIGLAGAASVDAKTLRWAARGDVLTMDPYTTDESVSANFANLIHDVLVERDRTMAITPRLATSWTIVDATTWRFTLRRGVRFHDGAPFTADDVVFSIGRAQDAKSAYAQYARALGKATRIDDYTVELKQERPNPLLLEHLNAIYIMSRAWAVAHHAERPIDLRRPTRASPRATRTARGRTVSCRASRASARCSCATRTGGVRSTGT